MKNLKTILLCKLVFSITTICFSQITFQRTFNLGTYDYGKSIKQTQDGNYVMCGQTGNGAISVYKINTYGDTLWARSYGGTASDIGFDIAETSDGSYIIGGGTNYGGGSQNGFLMKVNSSGDLLWTKTYGGAANDCIYSIQQSTDGGFIGVGSTYSFGAGNYDIYLIKTDSSGNLLWSKTYGGSSIDEGKSIQLTDDGGYIITGTTVVSSIAYNSYLLKTDSNGNVQWAKAYGGTSYGNYGFSVDNTFDKGFIITGYTGSGAGGDDAFLIKTDSLGNLQWSKAYGNTRYERANKVQQTSDSGYVFTGVTNRLSGPNFYYVVKTNSYGDTLWTNCFGDNAGAGLATSITETFDSGFIIYGYADISSVYATYVIKTDSLGHSNNCNQFPSQTIVNNIPCPVTNITLSTNSGGAVTSPNLITYYSPSIGNPCSITSIEDSETYTSKTDIFPNPFSTQTILQTNKMLKNATLTVYNSYGQQVKQIKNISGQTITFSRDNLSSGFYFLRLSQDDKIITTDKLVITGNY